MATSSVALRPLGNLTVAVSSQSGAFFGTRFWKKNSPVGAVDEALHRRRALAQVQAGGVGDREVVLGEVALGVAGLREEDLARAREPHLAPGRLDRDRFLGHRRDLRNRDPSNAVSHISTLSFPRRLESAPGARGGVAMDLMGTIEGTFSKVNSTVFRQVNRATDWWNLPTPVGAAQPARLPRRPARARTSTTPRRRAENGGRRRLEELPKYRTYDGSHQDPTDPEMGMVGSRFGRNAPADATAPEPMPELMDAEPARGRQPAAATATSFKPATTLNVLAACWIQFENHDWFGHGENAPDELHRRPARRGRRVARRQPDEGQGDEPRPHPHLERAACRRPTSTPSPTGGTARRSTARPRSATASCAPARTAR